MAYDYNSACIHQIPLAIDSNTSHTGDLDSRLATPPIGVLQSSLCITAMRDALQKDQRIWHRDLSLDNIILVKEPDSPIRRGYLIDWESSCRVDESGLAVEFGRTVDVLRFRQSERLTFLTSLEPGATCQSTPSETQFTDLT